jgi:hypothetical protein
VHINVCHLKGNANKDLGYNNLEASRRKGINDWEVRSWDSLKGTG